MPMDAAAKLAATKERLQKLGAKLFYIVDANPILPCALYKSCNWLGSCSTFLIVIAMYV